MKATLINIDEELKWLDNFPKESSKVIKKAMRQAATSIQKLAKASMPERFAFMTDSRIWESRKGIIGATVGLYADAPRTADPKDIPDWFKAYWMSYGTLSRRDPTHKFDNPIKGETFKTNSRGVRVSKRRNSVGQPATHFFDNGMKGVDTAFEREFKKAIDNASIK